MRARGRVTSVNTGKNSGSTLQEHRGFLENMLKQGSALSHIPEDLRGIIQGVLKHARLVVNMLNLFRGCQVDALNPRGMNRAKKCHYIVEPPRPCMCISEEEHWPVPGHIMDLARSGIHEVHKVTIQRTIDIQQVCDVNV